MPGTDYIDLLLIHWPNEEIPLCETLAAMRTQQEAGKVRHLGVSNFKRPLLLEALEHIAAAHDKSVQQVALDEMHRINGITIGM